jgi:hypothetical protein
MGVTRLERKGRKNKTVAKERVATIKRLKSKITVESPYKDESGIVIGTVAEVLAGETNKKSSEASAEEQTSTEEEE